MKKMKKEILIVLGFIIIGGSILGAIYMNNVQKEKLYFYEKAAEQIKQENIEKCLTEAETVYWNNWNGECKTRGYYDNCMLPVNISKSIGDNRVEMNATCIKKNN